MDLKCVLHTRFFYFFIFLVVIPSGSALDPEVKRKVYVLNPRTLMAATSVEDIALFGGGMNQQQPSPLSDIVNIFNATSTKWTKTTLSHPRFSLAATSVGKYALFGGGQTFEGELCSNVVDIFDYSTQTWSNATLSHPRCYLAATSVGKYALFGGGTSPPQGESDVVDIFDSSTLQWSTAKLSKARYFLAATSVGDYAVFAGGETNEGLSTDAVDIFDSTSQKWSTATLSQPRHCIGATSVGKYAMFAGGFKNQTWDTIDVFDSETLKWHVEYLSIPRGCLAATTIGQYALFGGGGMDGGSSDNVDVFDVVERTWFTTTLAVARTQLVATSVATYAIFASGAEAAGSNTIEVFHITNPASPTSPTPSTFNETSIFLMLTSGLLFVAVGVIVWMYIKRRNGAHRLAEDEAPLMDVKDTDEELTHETMISLVSSDIPFEDITIGDKLGEGSFGEIFKGKWNGQNIALKKLKSNVVSMAGFLEEARTLISLRHKHIVLSMGMTTEPETNQLLIVMEYMKNGSLYDLLFRDKVTLSQAEVTQLALDIAKGLNYLHCLRPKIIHRDLKSGNVLLYNNKRRAKVSDFGTARFLHASSAASTVIGTFGFIAPEVLQQLPYTEKADIYSFGALLFEMISNTQLPTIFEENKRVNKIEERTGDSEFKEIIVSCCRTDPDQRPTIRQCIDTLKQMKTRGFPPVEIK